VKWAILEPRGKISFIERGERGDEEQPPPQPKANEDDSAV
jgi:uncharacterized membrane protein YcaP (DUF421 family)